MRSILFLLCSVGAVFQLAAQFQPVLLADEVLYKIGVDLPDQAFEFADITVAEPEFIKGSIARRVLLRVGFNSDVLVGYVREDLFEGRMWFRHFETGVEHLVYDLNLAVGDSVAVPAGWCGNGADVARVLRRETIDNRLVITFDRTFGVSAFCDTLRYIEGVGPNATILYPFGQPDNLLPGLAYQLCRMRWDGALVYPPNAQVDLCGLMTPASELRPATPWLVYPNPVSETLHLAGLPPGGASIRLYDARGALVGQWTAPEGAFQLNLAHQPTGLYWLAGWDAAGRFLHRQAVLVARR